MNGRYWVSPYCSTKAAELVALSFFIPFCGVLLASYASAMAAVFGLIAVACLFGLILAEVPRVYVERHGFKVSFWRAL